MSYPEPVLPTTVKWSPVGRQKTLLESVYQRRRWLQSSFQCSSTLGKKKKQTKDYWFNNPVQSKVGGGRRSIFFFFSVVFLGKVLICRLGWLWTWGNTPGSASWAVELQVCNTGPSKLQPCSSLSLKKGARPFLMPLNPPPPASQGKVRELVTRG